MFITAFTTLPELIARNDIFGLQKQMKLLFISKCYIWPRFHLLICNDLDHNTEKTESDFVEIRISLTNNMKLIQNGILECLKECISELKRLNPRVIITYLFS